ncbi:GAF domain-containing sensor histidine kinase [Sideroxydans lithotrophicus]|uniref:histidine kinase n=1 Tax=Sideroxydans lithotrophicus (strain ES-1) TaxID=580332 RepID=D5CSM1_SIDLE|nr:ATP-binding protein [Sideroxydans lithotrophicus]ADE11957.1 signal transduction histidine kinase, nitrate/nitrite-specific, NarQ [Sideroxydans lithotrophicus ES-1]
MSRKIKLIEESDNVAFYWTRDPEFVLPGKNGGLDTCVEQEFATARSNDLKTLLNSFLETAIGFIKARACVVRVLLPDEQTLQLISAVGLTGEELEAERIVELACEDCGKDAFKHGLCSSDVETCVTRHGDRPHRQFRSVISIPLESRNSPEAMLGVFTLFFDTPQSTSGNAAEMAVSFADLLGTLLEHIKATREAKREELLKERQSIANEIHDSLAQTLNYARMNTTLLSDAVRNNNEVMATKYTRDIDEALEIGQKTVRTLITDFRSDMDPAGLLQALQTLSEQFRRQHNIVLHCSIRVADLDLPLEHEIQAYHIVREALSNIAKHSNASHARLIVDHLCGYYVFTVEDNGVGTFSPVEGHYGIIIMRERAQRIGGEIKVESTKGLGTCVQLFFPEPGTNWRTAHA